MEDNRSLRLPPIITTKYIELLAFTAQRIYLASHVFFVVMLTYV